MLENISPQKSNLEDNPSKETRDMKIEKAQISVSEMFDENMEAVGRIRENPYFISPSERDFK